MEARRLGLVERFAGVGREGEPFFGCRVVPEQQTVVLVLPIGVGNADRQQPQVRGARGLADVGLWSAQRSGDAVEGGSQRAHCNVRT